jgi:zinc protease
MRSPFTPVLLASLLAGLPGAGAFAATAGDVPAMRLDVETVRLDNGMTFLLVEHPDPARVAAGWTAHVGSADDPAGLSGVSHVLEHMMFKGSRTIGVSDPNELDALYARAGATNLNAFTRTDLTSYFVSVPANELELWFWLESDRLLSPVFRGLEGELKVIEPERQREEAQPRDKLGTQLNALFWQALPYRWPPIGWPSDAAAISAEAAERHFHTYYGPGNLTAVLVGHFDHARVAELARRYFGRLPAAPAPPRTLTAEPEQQAETRMLGSVDGAAELQVRYHTVPFRHSDSYALEVLAGLLDGGSGRLEAALVNGGEGVADQAEAAQISYKRAGFFSLTARARGDHGPEQLEQAWSEVLRRLQEEPVPAAELGRVKNRMAVDAFRQLREPFYLMVQLLVAAGEGDPGYLEEHARRIAEVSAEDVRRVARTYFQPRNRTVGLYRPAPAETKETKP